MNKGDIYTMDLRGKGFVQKGLRPVVVIQNDMGNSHSPTTIIACITRKLKKPQQPTHVQISDEHMNVSGQILCEQIFTVNKTDLRKFICTLTNEEINNLNHGLSISLDLDNTKKGEL